MIEKKLIAEKYIPSAQISYIRDYRRRLGEFLCSFNDYSVRKYARLIIEELDRIDLCVERYYNSMEESFVNIAVGDFIVPAVVEDPIIPELESRLNKKKKKSKR